MIILTAFEGNLKTYSKNFKKKFGSNEKIISPLHYQFYKTVNNMIRKNVHITTKGWFSPIVDYPICGACKAVND